MAENKGFISDASIDKILEDVRQLTGEKADKDIKVWSLDEIDALLSENDEADINNNVENLNNEVFSIRDDVEDIIDSPSELISSDSQTVDDTLSSIEDYSQPQTVSTDFSQTQENPKNDNVIDEIPIDTNKNNGFKLDLNIDDEFFEQDAETNEIDDLDQEIKQIINNYAPQKPITVSISNETSSSLGLKEFAKSKGIIEKEDSVSAQSAYENYADNAQQDENEFKIKPLIDGASEEESEQISDDDNDGLQNPPETDDIPGQITIEKTRLFNEVETRAIRNENIGHHIGNKIVKTGEIPATTKIETDPYRERFLNKPELAIEKTQEHKDLLNKLPAKTIEKHGVIIKKPSLDKTGEDGLSPVPILVDPSYEYDEQKKLVVDSQTGTIKSNALHNIIEEQRLDNQIVLDGFDEEDKVAVVNEEEAEEALLKVRKDRASKFRLFPNLNENEDDEDDSLVDEDTEDSLETSEQDEELGTGEDELEENLRSKKKKKFNETVRVEREFFGPKDAKAVLNIYVNNAKRQKLKIAISVIALIIGVTSSVLASVLGDFSLFAESPLVFVAINLLLLLLVTGVNFKSVTTAIKQLQKKNINSETAISVSLLFGIIQCLVSFGFADAVAGGMHIYAPVAILPVLFINIGEYIIIKNDISNFVLLNQELGEFYSLKQIEDDGIAFEIGRSLMIKDPDVRYNAKVNFPYKFVETSKKVDPTQDVFKLTIPIVLAAAVISGVISAVINKSAFVGVTAMSGVLFMGLPALSVISSAGILRKANKLLNQEKSMISGFEAVNDACSSNAVVIDASDLFDSGESTVYGIKLYNSMRIDEAILYTAAVVIQSDGPLKNVFDGIILSNREMLPGVESLVYEDRLGCSGWIYNYRVLVGNRDLLIKHNVDVQSKEMESKFTKAGRKVLYLAVEGKVAAMFVVGYKPEVKISGFMRSFEKSGVSVLVRTSDANITEELIEQYFDLPQNFIKVISPVAGVMFKQLSEKVEVSEPCRIVHNGKISSMLHAFVAAFSVSDQFKMSIILQYIGLGLGILIMSMLSFVSGLSQAGVLQILFYELFWAVIVVFIPRLKKI